MINLIVACSSNYVIGKDNDLVINNKEDMEYFKKLTTNNIVIMGRKTFESMKNKPLPNRINIVLTSQKNLAENYQQKDNLFFEKSLNDAVEKALKLYPLKEIFIIGGGQVYLEAISKNLVDVVYCNKFFEVTDGDTYFGKLNKNDWNKIVDKKSDDGLFEYKVFLNKSKEYLFPNFTESLSVKQTNNFIINKNVNILKYPEIPEKDFVFDKVFSKKDLEERQIQELGILTNKLFFIQQNLTVQDFEEIGIYNPEKVFLQFARNNHSLLNLLNDILKSKEQKLMLTYINNKLNN